MSYKSMLIDLCDSLNRIDKLSYDIVQRIHDTLDIIAIQINKESRNGSLISDYIRQTHDIV